MLDGPITTQQEDTPPVCNPWYMLKPTRLLASQQEYDQRLSVCAACPEKVQGFVDTCGKCNCILASKAKFVPSTCPLDKWETIIS